MRYGYTADTAPPGMRWAYEALAPQMGTQYGDLLPVARDPDGSIRLAMPNTIREGLLGIADLLSGVDTGEVTRRGAESLLTGGMGAGLGLGERGAVAMGGAPIHAYHGSPHSFDRFDFSKIGTGEGAQAYGHGLYFAGNEDVAKSYRNILSPGRAASPEDVAARVWHAVGADRARTIAELQSRATDLAFRRAHNPTLVPINFIRPGSSPVEQALELMRGGYVPKGSMYEVAIHADPQQFLAWDKPLAEQAPPVVSALQGSPIYQDMLNPPQHAGSVYGRPEIVTGGEFLRQMRNSHADPSGASEALRQSGIPGIRYLDQGSRMAGTGSSNYVVFPTQDDIIEILRKYGMAVPAPVGMPNSMLPPEEQVY